MIAKTKLKNHFFRHQRKWLQIVAVIFLISSVLPVLAAHRQSRSNSNASQNEPQQEKPVLARLYYSNIEDPRQLFDILQKTYHVQFVGADAVSGPITLISPGEDMVDLSGMLRLLDDVLRDQELMTQRDRRGQTVRIVPRQDINDKFIPLQKAEPARVVEILKKLYLAQENDKPEDKAKKATFIEVHPERRGILVRGPQDVFTRIEDYIRNTFIDEPLTATQRASQPGATPILREYISLDFMDPEEFKELLEADATFQGKFTAAVYRNSLAIYSRDAGVFEKIQEVKTIFDIDRMEIRYFPLSYAQAHSVIDAKSKQVKVKGIADLIMEIYPKAAPELPQEITDARKQLNYPDQLPTGDASEFVEDAMSQAGIIDPGVAERMSRALSVVGTGDDELVIVPDPERNGLLVRTFSRNIPKIQALIDVLDQPRDQVFIEAYITEVSLDDLAEMGIDWTLTHNEGTNTLRQSIPATTSILPGGDFPSVLSYELISDNFSAFLRALQQTGKVDVISRPSVTTKDNSTAIFEIGDKVPTLTSLRFSGEGLQSGTTVKYEDLTNKLEVTPQIHPDNYVTLDIHQTLDEVSARTIQISENFSPQIFITRSAQTQVRIKDGQTICLGGFVSDKIIDSETKVPLLGDIPLLGELFKYSKRQRIKTELIIFITPHILETPYEMLRMTNEQRRKSVLDPRERRGEIIVPERTLRFPPFQDPIKGYAPEGDRFLTIPDPNEIRRQDNSTDAAGDDKNLKKPPGDNQTKENKPVGAAIK